MALVVSYAEQVRRGYAALERDSIDWESNCMHESLLLARNGHHTIVQSLLEKTVDANSKSSNSRTPLYDVVV
jgi:hypothetical protein